VLGCRASCSRAKTGAFVGASTIVSLAGIAIEVGTQMRQVYIPTAGMAGVEVLHE